MKFSQQQKFGNYFINRNVSGAVSIDNHQQYSPLTFVFYFVDLSFPTNEILKLTY